MPDPTDRPPLLELTEPEIDRVIAFVYDRQNEREPNQRLLIEILDALRQINDKLAKLLEKR